MRTPTAGYQREMRVNMTPMIDVVFLLIIFFLVSSHLARQESQLPLPLPKADSGEEIDLQADRVVVNVTAAGELMLAGRRVSRDELARRLSNERQTSSDSLEVRIRSDRDVPFQYVQPVLQAVSSSGIGNVTFAVTARSQ